MHRRGRGLRGFGLGLLFGALTAATALGISVAAGNASWVPRRRRRSRLSAQRGAHRGGPRPGGVQRRGRVPRGPAGRARAGPSDEEGRSSRSPFRSRWLTCCNPNLTALGVGNIALAGIFLGVVFYAPGGIWTATGAHLGWNGMLACLDTPVSGLPFDIPLLDYRSGGPAWLTGGAFGVEGGLAATIALTIAIPLAARWARSGRRSL